MCVWTRRRHAEAVLYESAKTKTNRTEKERNTRARDCQCKGFKTGVRQSAEDRTVQQIREEEEGYRVGNKDSNRARTRERTGVPVNGRRVHKRVVIKWRRRWWWGRPKTVKMYAKVITEKDGMRKRVAVWYSRGGGSQRRRRSGSESQVSS